MVASLASFSGTLIYVDTMLPYMLLRGADNSVAQFWERIEQGELNAYTSALTFDELAYRLLLAFVKDKYDGSPLDRLRSEEMKIIAEFAPQVTDLLQSMRTFPNLTVLDVYSADINVMCQTMSAYQLRPRDAVHFAAMERIGCFDIASNDPHFDRVSRIRRYSP